MQRPRAALGYFCLVITMLGWSGAWITAKAAAHEAPPESVALGRFIVATLALLPAWLAIDRARKVRLGRKEWTLVLGMAITGVATYTVLFLVGVGLAPASDGAIITPGLSGMFAMLVAFIALDERPKRSSLVGAFVALAGVALVWWSAASSAGATSTRILGDAVFVAAAATWGLYTVLGRRLSDRVPAVTGVLLASATGAALLAPVVLVTDGIPDVATWSGFAWFNVVYLGLVATAVSFVTFYLGVQLVGIGRTAPFLGLVPVFAVLLAAVVLDEELTVLHALGGLLVAAGIVLPGLVARRRERPEAEGIAK